MHIMTPTAGALLACLSLIACGGGGDGESVKIESDAFGLQAAAPAAMSLEGCVVDAQGQAASRAVQAPFRDGRIAATGASGADGLFRLNVPAREVLRVEALGAQADGLTIMTGPHAASLGGRLRGWARASLVRREPSPASTAVRGTCVGASMRAPRSRSRP
jgi:hypothetical protein